MFKVNTSPLAIIVLRVMPSLSLIASLQSAECLQCMQDFKIQNIVGSCDVKFPIRLEGLAYSHSYFCSVRHAVVYTIPPWCKYGVMLRVANIVHCSQLLIGFLRCS